MTWSTSWYDSHMIAVPTCTIETLTQLKQNIFKKYFLICTSDCAHKKLQYFNGEFHSLVIGDFCARIIPLWGLYAPLTCIIGSPALLLLAIGLLLHNVCFILHLSLHKRILAKPQRLSLKIHLCASERSERAIFGVFNSFTVKRLHFFTINVKFEVILSSKSVGGIFVQAIPPPEKWGGGGGIHPPSPRDLRQCARIIPPWDLHLESPSLVLLVARLYTFPSHSFFYCYIMFALLYTFLYINDVKKRIHVLAKTQR